MIPARLFAPALALIWAGFCIGGAFIAVPAKFAAPSLSLAVALDVGRAQFAWIMVAESLICALFLISVIAFGGIRYRWAVIPVALFLVQQFFVMPPLDARTLLIIAGEAPGESQLHVVFMVVEILKLIALLGVAWSAAVMSRASPQQTTTPGAVKHPGLS